MPRIKWFMGTAGRRCRRSGRRRRLLKSVSYSVFELRSSRAIVEIILRMLFVCDIKSIDSKVLHKSSYWHLLGSRHSV